MDVIDGANQPNRNFADAPTRFHRKHTIHAMHFAFRATWIKVQRSQSCPTDVPKMK